MRTRRLLLLLLSTLFILPLLLSACRRQAEEEPTPTLSPTAVVVDEEPATNTPQPEPTEPPAPRPTATTAPEPEVQIEAVDPDTIDWAPMVVYSSPAPGEEALLDGAITIRFDQPMDENTVQDAFQIESTDDERVDGAFEWPQPDTLVFVPEGRLSRQQQYRVEIGTGAQGRNGRNLDDPLELFFDTVGYLEVSQVIPADGVNGVAADGSITVLFNRPVVPLVSTGQQEDLPDPLEISPSLDGDGEWISTSIYRFTPDPGFAGATEYTVTVPQGLQDVMGGLLAEDFTWTFTTAPPSVASSLPEPGAQEWEPGRPFTVTFNTPMDTASTEAAISLSPAHPLAFQWSEDNRTLSIMPQEQLNLGTEYTLTVADSAQPASGLGSLDRETSIRFSTLPFPAVTQVNPEPGQSVAYRYGGISIEFASPMDADTVRGRVIVVPAPEDEPDYFSSPNGRYFNVSFPMEADTEYTITIPGDAADPYGNTLGDDYTWQFRTQPPPPIVSLNLPSYIAQLSDSYPTTVDIVYRDVSTIEAALYNIGVQPGFLLEPYQVSEYLPDGQPLQSWTLSPDSGGSGALSLDLAGSGETLPLGVYYLQATTPDITENVRWWQNQREFLIVADTNLVVKEMVDAVHVWATDLATAEPAVGRNLTLYDADGNQVGTATTDGDGFASFPYTSPRDYLAGVLVVSGQPNQPGFGVGNSNWNQGIGPWQFGLDSTGSPELPEIAYLHTDRPIYRPGDTVHYRGILRDADYARYGLPAADQVTVIAEFTGFFGESDDSFTYQETLPVDENGTFNGSLVLPDTVQLGTYRLYLADEGRSVAEAFRTFTVAEYRRPEFMVTLLPEQAEALRGETVDVVLEARYFFGAPASDLPVTWTIYEKGYSFPWDGPFYSFDVDDSYYFRYSPDSTYFGNYLLEGTGTTNADGQVVITLPASLLEDVEAGSRVITVEAAVRDISEFPISANTQVVFHAAQQVVGVAPEDYLNQAGRDTAVNLITLDWEGDPVPNQTVDVTFYQREYRWVQESQFGGFYGTWEAEDTEVATTSATTDEQGRATASFVPEEGGTYRALATITDATGHTHQSSVLFWVGDSDYVAWRSNPEEKRMDLTPDQRTYEVGDTASILVQSPFAGPVNAWLTIERGGLLEQQLVTLESSSHVLEIPITQAFSPNAYVTVVAVQGITGDNEYADIRLGITEIVVPPDRFALNIELTPRSDVLAPGETVTYDIQVTDYAGRPVQADLSLALVDLAVLTLKEDNAPNILDAFYSRQPYRSQIGSGLIVSGEGLEVEIPEETGGGGGGGGGGEATADAPALRESEEEEGVRRDFPDTAFWRANLVTDANGQATVDIPLPDTLTTWRLSSKAVTADTLVGQTSVDIVATLPLLLRPVTPRFFTVNDEVQLGTVVNNNTDSALDVTVSLEGTGVTLLEDAEQEITVAANGQQLVRWPVRVEDVEVVDLTFRVEGGEYSDATKPSFGDDGLLPVYRYDAEDIVGTGGVLDEAGQRVEAILLPEAINTRSGSVDVRVTPSLAGALLDTLEVIGKEDDPPVCAHGIVSRFLPNLATAQALRDLDVEDATLAAELDVIINDSLSRLATLQKSDGGWGWCYSTESDEYLTAYVMFGVAQAADAGYSAGGIDIQAAENFLLRLLQTPEQIGDEYEANRQAWYLFVLSQWDAVTAEDLDALFEDDRELLDPYAKAYLALAYNRLGAADSNNVSALLADMSDQAVVSATGTHWEDASRDWRNLSSDIRGTAVVLSALSRLDPENPLAPGAVRWLMQARKAGYWSTPFETTWVILSLSDWMEASGELEADFDYELYVNSQQLQEGSFGDANITQVTEQSVPVSALPQDAINYLIFRRDDGPGRLYYTAHLDAFIDAEAVEAVNRGFTIERTYYDAECDPAEQTCAPLDSIEAGQRVRVELTIVTPSDRTFVRVEDPIPAGADAVDPGLATTGSGLGGDIRQPDRDYRYGYWGWWYFNRIEYRDDRVVFFSNFLPAGTYQYTYYLEPAIPGSYQVRPTVAYEEFFPEVFGRSAGKLFVIEE